MDYFKNHCWCSDSNWGGRYDCQIIVSLYSYKEGYKQDWKNVTTTKKYFDEGEYDSFRERIQTHLKEEGKPHSDVVVDAKLSGIEIGWSDINVLKSEVLDWLEENVKDFKGGKGWCVGSDTYQSRGDCSSLSVFFQRKYDALAFIRRWSEHKKPIDYFQYFTDVRKTLNLETGKYDT